MTIQMILEFIGALAALIIIHEFGHFIAARILKIEIEEFGIGFPPRIATLFEAGGTKYSLNWIPLGGFVRPKGENDPNVPGGLAAAKPWVRIAVFSAGPLANLLAAVLLYTIIFVRIGAPDPERLDVVEISGVATNSPAASTGLRPGDVILKVDDQVIDSTDKLHQMVYDNLGTPITLTYQRGEMVMETTLTPRENPPEGEGAIGVIMGTPTKPVSPLVAFPAGVVATFEHSKALFRMVGQIITGESSSSEGRLIGYKGMYDIYEEIRQGGPSLGLPAGIGTLGFFTSITISLGLLNLLPIPALDGGRILFTLPELIIGRRIPPEFENWVNVISFTLLLLLLIYINLQDFINPVQIPR